jgi:mannose-6-phosphate isomerase-like protein (cupin superfamily)
MADSVDRPIVVESAILAIGSISARVLLRSSDTAGGFGLIESPIPEGILAAPVHVHSNEDGWWYVLEGNFAAQVGEEVVAAGPSSLVRAPRGVPHTYWNPGPGPAKYLEFFAPAGLESFFERTAELLAADEPDVAAILQLPARYGLELDWQSVSALQDRHRVHLPGLPNR